jgi:hypothetical protein
MDIKRRPYLRLTKKMAVQQPRKMMETKRISIISECLTVSLWQLPRMEATLLSLITNRTFLEARTPLWVAVVAQALFSSGHRLVIALKMLFLMKSGADVRSTKSN